MEYNYDMENGIKSGIYKFFDHYCNDRQGRNGPYHLISRRRAISFCVYNSEEPCNIEITNKKK